MAKVKDIMLDIGTGDATSHRAYASSAMGQIKVSNAIFNAALMMNEMPDELRSDPDIVQEAYARQMTTDKEDNRHVANTAVANQLKGLYDEMVALAKDTEANLKSAMYLNKVPAKTSGIAVYAESYAMDMAKVADATGTFDLDGKKFMNGRAAKNQASAYIKGMNGLASAFGFNIKTNDNVVNALAPFVEYAKDSSLDTICNNIADAASIMNTGTVSADKDYTNKITKNDQHGLSMGLYAAYNTAKNIAQEFSKPEVRKAAFDRIDRACQSVVDKVRITDTERDLCEVCMECMDVMQNLTQNNIVKPYRDSMWTLTEELKSSKE
jgi:hypothetical protein